MYKSNNMGQLRTIITLAMAFLSVVVYSQKNDSIKVRLNHYSFTIGTGWTHYINNLESGGQNIQKDYAGVSLKFFWEPEHLLSLGLETGYYKLFVAKGQLTDNTTGQVDRSVIPLLLLIRMRIIQNVHLGIGTGIALINNKTVGGKQKVITETISLSNFEFSGAYIYPLSKHWLVGGEVKLFHFGNTEDTMYSIQATFAWRF
jgi:hypothetical protein